MDPNRTKRGRPVGRPKESPLEGDGERGRKSTNARQRRSQKASATIALLERRLAHLKAEKPSHEATTKLQPLLRKPSLPGDPANAGESSQGVGNADRSTLGLDDATMNIDPPRDAEEDSLNPMDASRELEASQPPKDAGTSRGTDVGVTSLLHPKNTMELANAGAGTGSEERTSTGARSLQHEVIEVDDDSPDENEVTAHQTKVRLHGRLTPTLTLGLCSLPPRLSRQRGRILRLSTRPMATTLPHPLVPPRNSHE